VAGLELVGELTAVDEDRLLALAHDELGAVLDLVVVAGEPPGQGRSRIIDPLDDVDQFALELVDESHLAPLVGGRPADVRVSR
jgi:hypothetical protein